MSHTNEDSRPGAGNVESLHPGRGAGRAGRRQIAAEDLERIVQRAAQMQQRDGEPGQQALTEDDVVQIGRQVGLEPEYVRRALAEVHAESLMPPLPADFPVLAMLAGEGRTPVRRVVPGEPADIQRSLETVLEREESLKPLRRKPGRSVWEPSSHLLDKVQRGLALDGRTYTLANARNVDLGIAELEPGWTLVTATADIAGERNQALCCGGMGVIFATLGAAAAVWSNVSESILLSAGAAILAAAASVAVAVPWMRWHVSQKRERFALALEGLLDRVDR